MMPYTRDVRRSAMGLVIAATLALCGGARAQTPFGEVDRLGRGRISFSAAERGAAILAGGDVAVSGEGFKPGQDVALFYGATPLEHGRWKADSEGKLKGTLRLPADAVTGIHPIVMVAQDPYAAKVVELKVSPTVPLSGQAAYHLTDAQAARGLYQTAYSAKANAIFVTAATGRPPVKQSELVKLDADSLRVLARATPAAAPGREGPNGPQDGGVFAVYGVGVDDAKDTVWVTNTRQNTVAVYRQSDLSLVKQFPVGAVSHPRDAVVDGAQGKAYISAMLTPEVIVFDTSSLDVARRIAVASKARGQTFSAASLSLDQAAHKLYVVSNTTSEVAVIDTRTDKVENVFPVPGARAAIGVSHDPQTGRIYVVAQETDNVVILDPNGAVVADTPIGAGALNVAFDPVKRRAFVASRGAGTITVTDPDGRIVANLGPAPMANHVALGKNGVVYAVDKSAGARDAESDNILRIKPR